MESGINVQKKFDKLFAEALVSPLPKLKFRRGKKQVPLGVNIPTPKSLSSSTYVQGSSGIDTITQEKVNISSRTSDLRPDCNDPQPDGDFHGNVDVDKITQEKYPESNDVQFIHDHGDLRPDVGDDDDDFPSSGHVRDFTQEEAYISSIKQPESNDCDHGDLQPDGSDHGDDDDDDDDDFQSSGHVKNKKDNKHLESNDLQFIHDHGDLRPDCDNHGDSGIVGDDDFQSSGHVRGSEDNRAEVSSLIDEEEEFVMHKPRPNRRTKPEKMYRLNLDILWARIIIHKAPAVTTFRSGLQQPFLNRNLRKGKWFFQQYITQRKCLHKESALSASLLSPKDRTKTNIQQANKMAKAVGRRGQKRKSVGEGVKGHLPKASKKTKQIGQLNCDPKRLVVNCDPKQPVGRPQKSKDRKQGCSKSQSITSVKQNEVETNRTGKKTKAKNKQVVKHLAHVKQSKAPHKSSAKICSKPPTFMGPRGKSSDETKASTKSSAIVRSKPTSFKGPRGKFLDKNEAPPKSSAKVCSKPNTSNKQGGKSSDEIKASQKSSAKVCLKPTTSNNLRGKSSDEDEVFFFDNSDNELSSRSGVKKSRRKGTCGRDSDSKTVPQKSVANGCKSKRKLAPATKRTKGNKAKQSRNTEIALNQSRNTKSRAFGDKKSKKTEIVLKQFKNINSRTSNTKKNKAYQSSSRTETSMAVKVMPLSHLASKPVAGMANGVAIDFATWSVINDPLVAGSMNEDWGIGIRPLFNTIGGKGHCGGVWKNIIDESSK